MKNKINRRLTPFPMKNRRGDVVAQIILVIGVFVVCTYALLSFNMTNLNVKNSFVGLVLVEQLNSQIEENYFYKQQTGTGKITEDETGKITEEVIVERDLIKAMDYATMNRVVDRNCECGDNCEEYVSFIAKASSENGISDPILLLALMMQESDCTSDAISYDESSYGIMQINKIHCGEKKYGLPSNIEECKKELMYNPEKNIEIGAKILKQYYDTFGEGKEFYKCVKERKIVSYSGWEAALRAYNGGGMEKEKYLQGICPAYLKGQEDFVEEVVRRYGVLKGNYLEREQTEGILWWIKKTISFSVEYKS
ncbi:MAG: transglycosylase SLT domain-containing protein [Nanoarchaeota archaeon]